VCTKYASQATDSAFVTAHCWSPLISYLKKEKRYKPDLRLTVLKERPIMYASHRDACILSFYASRLASVLDRRYNDYGLDEAVIAYRSLGKSNYDFAATALAFARAQAPCVALCFDVTGFFDHLDHKRLKLELKQALDEAELPPDWYAVFKQVTKFRHIELNDLKAHPVFGERLKKRSREPVATIAEITKAGIVVGKNGKFHGIPQGTPISAVLSNLYLWRLDVAMVAACSEAGALYQRYSDDILLICSRDAENDLTRLLMSTLDNLKLEIKASKTERKEITSSTPVSFQYLGFNISYDGAVIRPGSMARQWRKARRSIRRTRETGEAAIAAGTATKVFTRKLRRRFSPVGVRNFSSYARRSAAALGSSRILSQVRRLERMVDKAIEDMP
jgi:hypothetical protein